MRLDSSWVPSEDGYSLYIRPVAIGTSVSIMSFISVCVECVFRRSGYSPVFVRVLSLIYVSDSLSLAYMPPSRSKSTASSPRWDPTTRQAPPSLSNSSRTHSMYGPGRGEWAMSRYGGGLGGFAECSCVGIRRTCVLVLYVSFFGG